MMQCLLALERLQYRRIDDLITMSYYTYVLIRVFDKIFSMEQIGSGKAKGEPLYFNHSNHFKIVTSLCNLSQYYMNNTDPCYFTTHHLNTPYPTLTWIIDIPMYSNI